MICITCWLSFQNNFFKKFSQEHYQSAKWFGSRSDLVQTICKGYQQTTKIYISSCKTGRWNKESHSDTNGPAHKISELIASTSSQCPVIWSVSPDPSLLTYTQYRGRERSKPKIIPLTSLGKSAWGFHYFLASAHFCRLVITFANSLDPDQDGQNMGTDLDPNCLTLR